MFYYVFSQIKGPNRMVRVKGRRKAPSLRKNRHASRRRPNNKVIPGEVGSAGDSHLFQTSDTQSNLIRTARSLFSKKGFDGVSVKDVADTAKLNISLISYHFNGKEGLYKACLEDFGKECLESVRRVLKPSKTFEECEWRLSMFIDVMLEIFVKQPDASRMVFRECDIDGPIFQDMFQTSFLEIFKSLISFFEEGQKAGLITKKFDPHSVSSIFFGALSHFARMDQISEKYFGRTIKNSQDREKASFHLKEIFAKNLAAKVEMPGS